MSLANLNIPTLNLIFNGITTIILAITFLVGVLFRLTQQLFKRGRPNEAAHQRDSVLTMLANIVTVIAGLLTIASVVAASNPAHSTQVGFVQVNYTKHLNKVLTLAWSPDGHYIATGSRDDTVRIWKAQTGDDIGNYSVRSVVRGVAWSHDSQSLAATGDDSLLHIWSLSGSQSIIPLGSGGKSLSWSPDQRYIAVGTADEKLAVWNIALQAVQWRIPLFGGEISQVSWSPDGSRIAVSNFSRTVFVLDAHTGTVLLSYQKHAGYVFTLDWSPDSQYIVSGGQDNTHESGGADLPTTIRVWNASSGADEFIYQNYDGAVDALAWSHNGTYIASGGAKGIVQVWNASNGANVFSYTGQAISGDWINCIAWSPDDTQIVSASDNYTAQVWEAPH